MKQAEDIFRDVNSPLCFISEDFRGECTPFVWAPHIAHWPIRIPNLAWTTSNHSMVSNMKPIGVSDADRLFETYRSPFSFVGRDTTGHYRAYTYDPERCIAPVSVIHAGIVAKVLVPHA
jgi:hypothetical protein